MATKTEKQNQQEQRVAHLTRAITNKARQEAVVFFEKEFTEFDGIEMGILMAWVEEKRAKPIEAYNDMSIGDLEAILGVELV